MAPCREHASKALRYGTRSQGISIRVDRIFSWGALFFPKKLTTFLVIALKTRAKTTKPTKVTTPTLQNSPLS